MAMIGDIPEPEDFRYREIFLKGKPQHTKTDPLRRRHPSMDVGKRAKIFAPFDALRGFDDAVASKDVLYVDRRELNEEEQAELSRRLRILHGLTFNGRMARQNRVRITVTYYVPCRDENNESFGRRGQYEQVTGICRNVDTEVEGILRVDGKRIRIADIRSIESDTGLFEQEWENVE